MKRFFSLFAVLLLVLQMILPQLVTAQTTDDTKEEDVVQLLDVSAKKGTDGVDVYGLSGRVVNQTEKEMTGTITVSGDMQLKALDDTSIFDDKHEVWTSYSVKNNTIHFLIPAKTDTVFNFQVNGESQDGIVTFSDGKRVISPKAGEELETHTNQASANPAQKSDAPKDVKDILSSLGYGPKEQSILSDMVVTYTDKNGNVVTEPTVNDTIHFAFDWKLPDDVAILVNAGDYYSFKLPDNIKIQKNMTLPLNDYASAIVGKDGTVKIVFTDEVKGSSEVHGTLHFTAGFNENQIDGSGNLIIQVPDEENLPSTEVNIKPTEGAMIDKNGHFDKKQNPDNVIWNVEINKGLDTLENAKVTENLPAGLSYESVQVYEVAIDLHGKVIAGSEKLVTTGYTVDQAGNVQFTNPINGAYRLVYQTSINDDVKPFEGGAVKFTNNAVLTSDENPEGLSTSATVDAEYGKILTKDAANYDPKNQTFEWTVKYNYGAKHIDKADAVIKDTFGSDRMVLVNGSAKLYAMTFDASGTEIQGAQLVEGVDYELIKTAAGFEVRFLHDVDSAVKIQYKTGVTGTVDGNLDISNRVDIDTGQSSGSSGTAYQQNLKKQLSAVNYETGIASWIINVNENNYIMKNWKLTDTLSPGLKLDVATLKVQDVDGKRDLVEGTDYELMYDEATNIFTIEFLGKYKTETENQFRISYDTAFDMSQVWSSNPDMNFKNTAESAWLDQYDDSHSSSDEVIFNPNKPSKYNGFKEGTYNAKTKVITWSIGVNYEGTNLSNAKIVDPILGNQRFVKDSVKIYKYSVNPDGSVAKGEEITNKSGFTISEPSESNNETLTVDFPNGKVEMYLVEFETSVKGQIVTENYKNDAVFTNDTYPDHTLSADVTVKYGGKLALKSGMQDDDGFVNWSITVNPSLSQMSDVVVTDRPSTNQTIDLESLVVHPTSVSADGTLTTNASVALVEGVDYTAELTTDNVTGQQELKVSFVKEINEAYVIKYRTMVLMTGAEDKVSNNVKITGNHDQEVTGGDSSTIDVVVSDGGGTGVGTKGSISFQKVNPSGDILHDAQFQLWDKSKRMIMREGKINEDGKITFGNLPYGTYILKEVKAPSGYTISDELLNGKAITISKSSSTANVVEKIVNAQNKVTLIKHDEQGQALAGAVFKLQWQVGEDWLDIRADETFETDADGRLVIEGLLPANYRLIETQAPQGFIVNTEVIPFTVTQNEDGQIPDVAVPIFVNYQGSIQFMKKDESGKGLAGAEFALQNEAGETLRTLETNADGIVNADGLAPGEYTIVETKAPNGYIINTNPLHFTIAGQGEGKPETQILDTIINYQGSASLVKKDENGDLLAGAIFKVVDQDGATIRENLETNEEGRISVTDLAPGTYKFVEVSAPQGYLVNTTPVEFTIADTSDGKPQEIQTTFIDYQGSFELLKENSSNEPLQGAVFELRDADDNVMDTITSTENGIVAGSGIAPGKYTLVEVKAPAGYILNSYPIELEIPETAEGEPISVDLGVFNNFKGKVALVKQGANEKALVGAVFTIYDINGKVVGEPVAASDGRIEYGDLAPGYYKIVETKAPDGYIINTNPTYFTILDKYPGNPDLIDVGRIVNYQGEVELTKTNEEHQALADAHFNLLNQKTGEVLQTDIVTDADGKIKLTDLRPGDYRLIETKAPQNYILNTAPINFTVHADLLGKPEVIQLADFVNYQGEVTLTKIDSGMNPLAGAEFKLLNDKNEVIADSLVSDENGEISVDKLAPGSYYFVETKAPVGYEKNETPIPFQIEANAKDRPLPVQLQFENQKTPTKLPPVEPVPDNKPDKKPSKIPEINTGETPDRISVSSRSDKGVTQPATTMKDSKLPATGDSDAESIIFVMMGAILLAGWLRLKK